MDNIDGKYPLITIGITCYNAEKSIEAAVASAIAQDWPNKEIIIVDDCSADNSFVILLNLKHKYDYLIIHRFEINGGVSASRNKLLEYAKGEYIAFFDDDDVSQPQRLKVQIDTIQSYNKKTGAENICCFSSIRKTYSNGYEISLPSIGSKAEPPSGKDIVNYQLFMGRNPGVFFGAGTPSCALMCKTSLLKKAGGYDTTLKRNEDTDISIRLGLEDTHFIGCKEELVLQTASTGTDKRPEVGYESEDRIVEKYKDILLLDRKYFFAKDWVKMRFYHFSGSRAKTALMALCMLIKHPGETATRLYKAAPARLIHERKMARKKSRSS